MAKEVLLGVAAGIVVGVFFGWWATADSDHGTPGPAVPSPGVAPTHSPGPDAAQSTQQDEATRHSSDQRPVVTPSSERSSVELLSPELLAFAADGIRGGWREERSDEIPEDTLRKTLDEFAMAVRTLPESLGRRAARQSTADEQKAAALAGNDLVEILRSSSATDSSAVELVHSDRFRPLFAPRIAGITLDGASLKADAKLQSGTVVTFPAGVWRVGDLARSNNPFPDEITLRGGGMDATLLVMDAQSPRNRMQRFAIEDCTVFVENGILDARREPAVLALSRVRVVGFDSGAGGSLAISTQAVGIAAFGCRFEGGYGSAPNGLANVLRSRDAGLARFEQCAFERVSLADADSPSVLFVDCTMTDMLRKQPDQPTFRNCTWSSIPAARARDLAYRSRDLNTLFPQWRELSQRR